MFANINDHECYIYLACHNVNDKIHIVLGKGYDDIGVKQGYIFHELKAKGKLSIMLLTKGTTLQDIKNIDFKRIMHPMFPIDNI